MWLVTKSFLFLSEMIQLREDFCIPLSNGLYNMQLAFGNLLLAGQTIRADASYETLPLFVKAEINVQL